MTRGAGALVGLFLSACAAASSPDTTPVRGMADIAGQWDIVSFDGHTPRRLDADGGRHAYVDFSTDGATFTIECNYTGMRARIENGRLVALPHEDIQTAMGCGPERNRRESAFFAFLRGSPTIAQRGADELVLTRGGQRLELQRAEVRQRAMRPTSLLDFDGAWRADIVYLQIAEGHTGNLIAGLDGAPAEFSFDNNVVRLRFDCETAEAGWRMTAPGVIETDALRRRTTGGCRLSQEERDHVASLISGAIAAERISPEMMQIVNGDVRAVLVR